MVSSSSIETDVKRALLQIKTSDRNVQHRFRTHWDKICPGAFKKTTLVGMCRDLGIHAPVRMLKGQVFERLIHGLRGGMRMQMQMQMQGGALTPTRTLASSSNIRGYGTSFAPTRPLASARHCSVGTRKPYAHNMITIERAATQQQQHQIGRASCRERV